MDNPRLSRRSFLRTAGQAAALGGMIAAGVTDPMGLVESGKAEAAKTDALSFRPLVWVWKFSVDGSMPSIRDRLSGSTVGVILKTHDGTQWMDHFDHDPDAVTGPGQVARLAAIFENAGVPFHAWCVVQGNDPIGEAQRCADVLSAGARSLFIDLEPPEGNNYWQGPFENALRFGEELRRRQPDAWLAAAPDARPWQKPKVPLDEFMSFVNAVAPQSYWETFNSPTNRRYMNERGYVVGDEGVTPELIVDVCFGTFQHYGRYIQPIGQGASSPEQWRRFVAAASAKGFTQISMWRYGTADPAAFDSLRDLYPFQLLKEEPTPIPQITAPPAVQSQSEQAPIQTQAQQQESTPAPEETEQPKVEAAQSTEEKRQGFFDKIRELGRKEQDGVTQQHEQIVSITKEPRETAAPRESLVQRVLRFPSR